MMEQHDREMEEVRSQGMIDVMQMNDKLMEVDKQY